MKEVALLLSDMVGRKIIDEYAIFGAMAQMRYTEAVVTMDVDIDEIEGVPLRVVRADYLAVIALDAGRAKDYSRILALIENNTVSIDDIEKLATSFGLGSKWVAFKEKFFD